MKQIRLNHAYDKGQLDEELNHINVEGLTRHFKPYGEEIFNIGKKQKKINQEKLDPNSFLNDIDSVEENMKQNLICWICGENKEYVKNKLKEKECDFCLKTCCLNCN